MPRNYAAEPRNRVKRKDRPIKDESWMREFLHQGHWGAMATVQDGQPFINTNLFLYDERKHSIYTHTARFGRTRANLDSDDNVCFAVSTMGRILPAETAVDFSVEYEQVTIFGTGRVVHDRDEGVEALKLLLGKYAPHLRYGQDYGAITAADLKRTSVYRVDIAHWSGKRKSAETDYTNSYRFSRDDCLRSLDEAKNDGLHSLASS